MKEKNGATINMAVVGAKGSGKSGMYYIVNFD